MNGQRVAVDAQHVVDSADLVSRVAALTPLPTHHPWGPNVSRAVAIELLVSTLSHALNEDYMLARLVKQVTASPDELLPSALASWAEGTVAEVFAISPRQRRKEDPARLAEIIRANFSHYLSVPSERVIARLLDPRAGKDVILATSEWLRSFPAFAGDPLQKKSALFLQRLYLQRYIAPEIAPEIPFAIDRHIVRLALRVGWVRPDPDSALSGKIRNRAHMSRDEDLALRSAVLTAMQMLVDATEIQAPVINFVLWQFARSYCARYKPGCISEPRLLGRGAEFIPPSGEPCLLAAVCLALRDQAQLVTLDPVHRGGFY